jgi:hypothetical protein
LPRWNSGYIFRWDRHGRKGQRCVVLVRGTMNSCLVRFEDGYMVPFNPTVATETVSANAASRFATANCRSWCRSHG